MPGSFGAVVLGVIAGEFVIQAFFIYFFDTKMIRYVRIAVIMFRVSKYARADLQMNIHFLRMALAFNVHHFKFYSFLFAGGIIKFDNTKENSAIIMAETI